MVLLLEPVCVPLCALAARSLDAAGRPVTALRALHVATEALHRVGSDAHVRAHAQARDSASAALADIDDDGRLLDRVVADLTSDQAGDPQPLRAWFDPAAIDPPLWTAYVSAVQATHRALWIARHELG